MMNSPFTVRRTSGSNSNYNNNNNNNLNNNLNLSDDNGMQTIRILLLGDSGVGKTSVVNYLCDKSGEFASSGWTVGCHLEAIIFESSSTGRNRKCLIEFIDIGGGSHGYAASRSVFYTYDINAILLVHDLSNNRSFSNLFKWIDEFAFANGGESSTICNKIPMLLVGNKLDKLNTKHRANNNKRKQEHKQSMKNINIYNAIEISTLINNAKDPNNNRNHHNNNNQEYKMKFHNFFHHILNNYNGQSVNRV